MKHRLIVDFDASEHTRTWDMRVRGKGKIDIGRSLKMCLKDLKRAKIESFTCARIGPDTTEAIENCETVYSMGPMSNEA